MAKKYTLLFAILILLSSSILVAQEKSNALKYIPSIGAHGGVMSYFGDVKGSNDASFMTNLQTGYGFYLEKKFGSIFGITSNGIFGKIAQSQLDNSNFRNFESKILNFDLNLLLDFDNGKVINESSFFAPFISVGFGYLMFDPKGDLSKDGALYHHWDDGTLRNIAQNVPGADTLSQLITRDYDYETTLEDSTNNYTRTSFTIPLRFGLKFKLSNHLDFRISAAYMLTLTDYLDNHAEGGNDNLLYTSFGLQYNFKGRSTKDDKYKDFDFSNLDKEDSDNDGVIDTKDLCQGTPEKVKVDSKGCALDGDKDGVPDYKDKELNTAEGVIVNENGITLTDEMIAMEEKMRDSVEVERRAFTIDDLTLEEVEEIRKQHQEEGNVIPPAATIPEKFISLDKDKDDYINAKEVTIAIDEFFEGENNLSAKDLNDLIDFYFDQ